MFTKIWSKDWVLWSRAPHFAALEWCGSAEASGRLLYCSVKLTARVLWDWGGLASSPRCLLRTWTGDTFTHHLVTTFFTSCSWHFRSPWQSGKSSVLMTKLPSRQHWGEFPWKAATLTARWTSMLLPTRKEEGNFLQKMTFYLQKKWLCISKYLFIIFKLWDTLSKQWQNNDLV